MKTEVKINIDTILYNTAKQELQMSLDDFVEYSLRMLLHQDDEYSKLFQQGAKLQDKMYNIRERMYYLEKRNHKNKDDEKSYENALDTVNRIHKRLGYIGKNQLKKIANQNNLNHQDLINYVEQIGVYTITNFGDSPKYK